VRTQKRNLIEVLERLVPQQREMARVIMRFAPKALASLDSHGSLMVVPHCSPRDYLKICKELQRLTGNHCEVLQYTQVTIAHHCAWKGAAVYLVSPRFSMKFCHRIARRVARICQQHPGQCIDEESLRRIIEARGKPWKSYEAALRCLRWTSEKPIRIHEGSPSIICLV
jgi:hypothetical protein